LEEIRKAMQNMKEEFKCDMPTLKKLKFWKGKA
jgi:hypothetical protein